MLYAILYVMLHIIYPDIEIKLEELYSDFELDTNRGLYILIVEKVEEIDISRMSY